MYQSTVATANERIAEIERRFGRPLLWRLGLAAPPSRHCGPFIEITEAARRPDAPIAQPEQEADTQTSAVLMQSPSPARTSPSIRTRAVSTAGRATGAPHARGAVVGHSSGTTD